MKAEQKPLAPGRGATPPALAAGREPEQKGEARAPRQWRWARVLACNLALVAFLLAIAAVGAELWLRFTVPFAAKSVPLAFVPSVGLLHRPGAEIRYTSQYEMWTISRANSLGFVAREPPAPAETAQGCHVAVIGDSFVAALEVPITAKLPSRLEAIAGRRAPEWDISASAFGRGGTGQIAQLAYYDHYVRPLAPKLVVLVFVGNDFVDNFGPLAALYGRWDPRAPPYLTALEDDAGRLTLRPPSPSWAAFRARHGLTNQRWRIGLPLSEYGDSTLEARLNQLRGFSWLLDRLYHTRLVEHLPLAAKVRQALGRAGHIYGRLDTATLATLRASQTDLYRPARLPAVLARGLGYTAFAFEAFQRRARRDGFRPLIVGVPQLGPPGAPIFDRLGRLAAGAGIEVVNLHAHIAATGAAPEDASWPRDRHFTAQGHAWAAQAVFAHLRANPEICAKAAPD